MKQILSPEWLVPVVPAGLILENHSLILADERIEALLPREEAIVSYPDAVESRLQNQLMTPGFINVHGHAAMTLMRGLADDREMMDWLTKWIWPIEGQVVDKQFVYDGTRLAVLEMIMSGTTCASELYFFPDVAAKAINEMHFRAQITLPVLKLENSWAKNEDDHIHKGLAFRDNIKHDLMITTAFAPHAPYTVSDRGFEKIKLYAEQLNIPIHLHLHETARECDDSIQDHGVRPIARMDSLGILSSNLQAIHMTQLRDDEIDLLSTHAVQIAHCPESNLKLSSGICRVHELKQAGINVALGTDGAASNNDLDMIQEARTAALTSKSFTGNATSLKAFEALEMMTIAGAKFLGLESNIGSLEAGKLADITCVDLSSVVFQPIYNPVSQLIYTATGRDVQNVWIHGRQLVKNGNPQRMDITSIASAAKKWRNRIRGLIE